MNSRWYVIPSTVENIYDIRALYVWNLKFIGSTTTKWLLVLYKVLYSMYYTTENFEFFFPIQSMYISDRIKLKSDLTPVSESELQSYSFWASFSDVNKIESNDDGCGSQSAG